LALTKIIDNVIITAKNIATYKEQKLLSSVLVVISQFLFYFIISKVIDDNSVLAIVVVAVSSGVGSYIAFTLNQKFRKPAKWTMVITSSDVEDITGLSKFLSAHHIRHIVNKGYTRKWEETLHVIVFSKDKEESRLIESYLKYFDKPYLKEVI
jgi:uncharacterized protein YebE (UPF0316 family)